MADPLAPAPDELQQNLQMFVNDRLELVPSQDPHRGLFARDRAGRPRLLVEDGHLSQYCAGAVSRQRDLASFMVEMYADLTLQDTAELGADVPLREDRFALGVGPSHHEAIDAGQLLKRQRAEQRHLLTG